MIFDNVRVLKDGLVSKQFEWREDIAYIEILEQVDFHLQAYVNTPTVKN